MMIKKETFRRILIALLVLCQIASVVLLAGCQKNEKSEESTSGTTTTTMTDNNPGTDQKTEKPEGSTSGTTTTTMTDKKPGDDGTDEPVLRQLEIVKDGKTDYVIVRSQTAESWELDAAKLFRTYIRALTGVDIPIKDDFEREGTDEVRTDKEIIIGSTNRENEFDADYASFDKGYSIFSSKYRFVILAGSEAGMDAAFDRFFSDVFGISVGSSLPETPLVEEFNINTSYKMSQKYTSAELPFIGVALKDYTIVFDNKDYMQLRYHADLDKITSAIAGTKLPVSTQKNNGGKNIIIEMDSKLAGGYFKITVSGSDITISVADYYGFNAACKWIKSEFSANGYFKFKDGFSKTGRFMDYLTEETSSTAYAFERAGSTRVMFNNVLWQDFSGVTGRPQNDIPHVERHRLTTQMVSVYLPDVLGLQEVKAVERNGENGIVTMLNGVGYTEVLNSGVSGMANSCTPLFYRQDTTKLIDSGFMVFKNQPTSPDTSKSMTWGVFESKTDNQKYLVVSVHLETINKDIAVMQVGELTAKVAEIIAQYYCPVIVGGDYNAKYSETPYQAITNDYGYTSAREIATVTNNTVRTNQSYPKFDTSLQLMKPVEKDVIVGRENSVDHITLYKHNSLNISLFGIVVDDCALSASDHLPIFMDFTFGDEEQENDWTEFY